MVGWLVFMGWVVGLVAAVVALSWFDLEGVVPDWWREQYSRKPHHRGAQE